jgi:predicted O-linked N-acetylglucosamine transferase (SPINDLY family)
MVHALEGDHRDRALRRIEAAGVDRQRIEFVNRLPSAKYFEQYNAIDIALDPFPYPGGTTSCDALWMGVPVITLAGRMAVARGGVSILSNVGLTELIAQDRQQYIEIAAKLANDRARLKSLRTTLRQRMQISPLMDALRFAQDMETAYRSMWRNWCEARKARE